MVFPASAPFPGAAPARGISRPPRIELPPALQLPDDPAEHGSEELATGPLSGLSQRHAPLAATGSVLDFRPPRGPEHQAQMDLLRDMYAGICSQLQGSPALLKHTDRMVEDMVNERGVSDTERCRKLLRFLSGMGASVPILQADGPAISARAMAGRGAHVGPLPPLAGDAAAHPAHRQ